MTSEMKYTMGAFEQDCRELVNQIKTSGRGISAVYGVPRGGIPLAVALSHLLNVPLDGFEEDGKLIVSRSNPHPLEVLVVDDVIDSGRTRDRFSPLQPFACLHEKGMKKQATFAAHRGVGPGWIHYWWEAGESTGVDIITRQLELIGEDPTREGLLETPARVVRSWSELFAGYKQDPTKILKSFKDGACDEMVLLKGIEFYSCCEHHMLLFSGKAHIAYIPDGRVVGISKLARLLEVFARRLQIQERLGQQITETLMKELKPKGAACILEAQHLCMTSRGVKKQDSIMVTSSLTGVFRDRPEARAELMGLIK